jgi:hypothetical protein
MPTVNIIDYRGHTIRANAISVGFETVVYEDDIEVSGGGFGADTEVAAIERAKAFVDRRRIGPLGHQEMNEGA